MNEAEINDFLQKVETGLMEAQQKMLEEKALHNQTLVVSDGHGGVRKVCARQILAQRS